MSFRNIVDNLLKRVGCFLIELKCPRKGGYMEHLFLLNCFNFFIKFRLFKYEYLLLMFQKC